jgi:general secretion pathway protein E
MPLSDLLKSDLEQGFLTFLGDDNLLDAVSQKRVSAALQNSGQSVQTILLELGLLEEAKLADAMGRYLGFERVPSENFSLDVASELNVPPEFMLRALLLPLDFTPDAVTIAVSNPLDTTSAQALAYSLGRNAKLKIALSSELTKYLSTSVEKMELPHEPVQLSDISANDVERLRDIASEAPIIRLLNKLIVAAVDRNASDIHIELLEDHVRIRYRIDGALLVVDQLDRNLQLGLLSRIKILARLNIAEQRLPQDGRIRLAIKGRDIDLRVATTPTLYGENVVLRILDRKGMALDLASLGFEQDSVRRLNKLLSTPNGVILVTGPTGSGKTTTLYAALSELNNTQSKLFTIEDPIEYHLKGITQIPVQPQIGLDFAAVLRSVLRQDPDVIMVGEIRDSETAKISVQASLTGHLVLSTLHTNSAAASITRLRHMGIENFLISSSVRAIIAQRLVRKICKHLSTQSEAAACVFCHGTGYAGRTVIYEILEITVGVQQAVLAGASDVDIEKIARNQGMMTLKECGQRKIAAGETTQSELARVLGAVSQ